MIKVKNKYSEEKLNERIQFAFKDDYLYLEYVVPSEDYHMSVALATYVHKKILAVLDEAEANEETPIRAIINLGNGGRPSLRARKIYVDLLGDARVREVAVCGGSRFLQALVSFLAIESRNPYIKFFASLPEAKKWISEQKKVKK